jgi:hypothetical protein
MLVKAVANATKASFIRVVGSEFVQKYLGEVSFPVHSEQNKLTLPGTSNGTRRLPSSSREFSLYHIYR